MNKVVQLQINLVLVYVKQNLYKFIAFNLFIITKII